MAPRIEFSTGIPLPRGDGGAAGGARRDVEQPAARIDLVRMDKALKGQRSPIPGGLSPKQIVEFLNNAAKKRA